MPSSGMIAPRLGQPRRGPITNRTADNHSHFVCHDHDSELRPVTEESQTPGGRTLAKSRIGPCGPRAPGAARYGAAAGPVPHGDPQ
eukprot:764497-Hanusia_phi.AAC.3